MDTVEVWKSPPSLGRPWVEVSNLGRVRTTMGGSYYSINGNKYVIRRRRERILKGLADTRGRPMYLFPVGRSAPGVTRGCLVARLVAECFVPNPKPKLYNCVFHKDGDVTNCVAENLEWGSLNDRHRIMRGKYAKHLIALYRDPEMEEEVRRFRGLSETARWLGVTKQDIHACLMHGRGRMKGYYGKIIGECEPIKRTILDIRRANLK